MLIFSAKYGIFMVAVSLSLFGELQVTSIIVIRRSPAQHAASPACCVVLVNHVRVILSNIRFLVAQLDINEYVPGVIVGRVNAGYFVEFAAITY